MEPLSGVIERITFHNLDTGYCVLRVQARGHRDLVTVVGHLAQVVAGEHVQAVGEWVTDRSHGPQFKASDLRTTPPHTTEGIAKFLGSGLVKGIGKTYAKKIVDVFGEKTLDTIERSPAYLSQVKGIGAKRIELIRKSWEEVKGVRAVMVFLHSYGVGTARAVKIYKQYGDGAIETVRQNPYRLSTDIWGIGFRTADEIALKLGIPRDSPHRAQAAVRHVLSEGASNGHVGSPELVAVEQTAELTNIPPEAVVAAVEELIKLDEVVRDDLTKAAGGGRVAVEEGDPATEGPLLYLKPLFLAELGVARSVRQLRTGDHPLPATDVDAALGWVETKMGIRFADAQRAAVRGAVTQKLLVLTGGPGTGKTTIVRAILELFQVKGQRVALCAPTGRAAKRLSESTGREAKTVHRLLEFDPAINTFRRTKEHPLDLDLIVVDEASMLDVVLANQLLRAVPAWAAVVLVGDVDQLPSVGAGSVLGDLIGSGVVPVVRLTEVHRQAGQSWIVRAAHAVNQGAEPESAPAGGDGDFYFVEADDPATVLDRLVTMVQHRIPARFGLDPLRDVQVLSPMNKSDLGVANLNQRLQAALNPPGPGKKEVSRYSITYRAGDKVIQTRNNYQREVFNGDIGRVLAVDPVDQVLTADFDGRAVDYDFADIDELQLAYAVSIHKSQGSEYPAVVIPVHTQHFVMLQRNLLYTGLTRGRKLVVLVGSRRAVRIAVQKADTARRFSLLRWRLRAGDQS
jgi:exodeoxyribonuclease V alpha subunit